MTISIKHNLEFVTELDENNETAQQLLSMPDFLQREMLEGMLKSLVAPRLQPILDELNENNSFATLKVAK